MPSTHMNSWPAAVLREIFLVHVRTAGLHEVQKSRSDLCLVCRRWKQIAVSSAGLWSTIYIYLQNPVSSCPPTSTVSLLLNRSMNLPLEIHIRGADMLRVTRSANNALRLYASTLFSLLASQAFRWKCLVIDLDNTLVKEIQNMSFAGTVQLEYVGAKVEGSTMDKKRDKMKSSERDIAVISALADAPNLRLLRWNSTSDDLARHMVTTFPLERLIHANLICPMTLPELLQVMQKCTSVVELGIGADDCDTTGIDDNGNPLPSVVLPNLRALMLAYDLPAYDMFKYFDFPNLEILNIVTNDCSGPIWVQRNNVNDITPVLQYLSKSRHRLQILIIHDHDLPLEDMINFLSDPAVYEIPIVQVCTSPLPDDIRDNILEAVGARLPDTRRAEFRVATGYEGFQEPTMMGWTDSATYERFKDYLHVSSDNNLACIVRRHITRYE